MTLRADDQATVDRAAAAVPSVIDALIAEIPPARRAELEAQTTYVDASWLSREGDDGAFVLADRCRRELRALAQHAYSWTSIIDRVRMVVRRFETRPLGPWLWIEMLGAIPSHKRTAVEYVSTMGKGFTDNYLPAARAAIRAKIPARGLLFERLRRDDALQVDEMLDGLADPPLRAGCEHLLRDRVPEVEPRLREMVDGATPGTREAIVRLLRTVDEHVDLAGQTTHGSLADLETRLRADPTDLATAQVWADLLQDQGDPRGALLALDLAIVQEADRERALVLSGERATLFARDRKHVLGKPGGFPFREKYLGRGYLMFGSSWRGILRGKPPTVFDKVMAFLTRVTDAGRPTVEIDVDGLDDDGFRERCIASAHLMHATFKLVWPGTRWVVPYQEAGHYPGDFESSLRVNLASGGLELALRFPFENFEDPQFVEIYDAVAATLGKIVLTPTGFAVFTPTVDGKKMKSKLQRYRGPG